MNLHGNLRIATHQSVKYSVVSGVHRILLATTLSFSHLKSNMSAELPPAVGVEGLGSRRKGPKTLPRLPMSAFSPPNSGIGERFPLPPSPSTIHPDSVVDAHIVTTTGDLSQWKQEAGKVLGSRIRGVVLNLQGKQPGEIEIESAIVG